MNWEPIDKSLEVGRRLAGICILLILAAYFSDVVIDAVNFYMRVIGK